MLQKLSLQNFRNYAKKSFEFGLGTTLIVGPNASGKTNILEAIYALATGRSFRAELEKEVIEEGESLARVEGKVNKETLEIIWDDRDRFWKHYRINGIGRRQVEFVGHFRAVLFGPSDIEIVADSPSARRRYLDLVLSLVHKDYRIAAHIYERALRQRNRLLWRIREEGVSRDQLGYWDDLLVDNGRIIHERRKEFLDFLSAFGDLRLDYDHSIISLERLRRYAQEEVASATTLVGPQRDDFLVSQKAKNVKAFGSRGEQRLAVFTIKLGELEYVRRMTGEDPVLLLDDIFSELDLANRHHVLKVIPKQQTIMTTTDLHLVEKGAIKSFDLIKLG